MSKTKQTPLGTIAVLAYAAEGASILFIPLFAQEIGASYLQVGIVGLSYGMAFFVASFLFGWQSDRYGRINFIKVGLGLTSIVYLFQLSANSLPYLIIIRGLVGFCYGISSAALLAYTFETEGVVGRFTSYSALGLLGGAVAASLIRQYDYLFIVSAVLCLVAFIFSLQLKTEDAQRKPILAQPVEVVTREWKTYLAFLLRQTGAWGIWVFLPLFLADIGASKPWIAIMYMINFAVQFIAMRYVERFHEGRMFSLGLILSGIVFLAYSRVTNYLQVIPVQVLLGISWSAMYVGALVLLMRSGEERGTSTGILFSITSLCQGTGPFLAGTITQFMDFRAAMLSAAFMSFVGLPLSLRSKARK